MKRHIPIVSLLLFLTTLIQCFCTSLPSFFSLPSSFSSPTDWLGDVTYSLWTRGSFTLMRMLPFLA